MWWWILHGFPSHNEYINIPNFSSLCSKNTSSSFALNFRFFCSLCFLEPLFSPSLLIQMTLATEKGLVCHRRWQGSHLRTYLHVPPPYFHTKHRNQSISILKTVHLPYSSIIHKISGAKWGPQGLTNYCTFSLLAFLHFHLAIKELPFLLPSQAQD